MVPTKLHVRQHDGDRVRRVRGVNSTGEGSTRWIDLHHALAPTNDASLDRGVLDHCSAVRSDSNAPSRRASFSGTAASRSRMRFSSVSRRPCSLTMSCSRSSSLRDLSARRNAPWASPARCSSKRRAIAEYDAPPSRSSSACSSTVFPGGLRRGWTRSRVESLGPRLSVRLFELCLGKMYLTNPKELPWRVDPAPGGRYHGWPFVPRIACTGQTESGIVGLLDLRDRIEQSHLTTDRSSRRSGQQSRTRTAKVKEELIRSH